MSLRNSLRWALGMYNPAAPDDLRLTEIGPVTEGVTEVISNPVIPEERRRKLIARQERQHLRRNQIMLAFGEAELEEIEQQKQDDIGG